MASSVKVDLGISKYKKSYEFKTDWYHQRPDSGFFHSLQLSDDELEEDMKDEIDSVMGLLDRLKEERKQELMSSQTDKLSRLEKLKRSRLKEARSYDPDHGEKYTTIIETRVSGSSRPPDEPVDVKIRLNRDQEEDDEEEARREGQHKRKQDFMIAELREKAEIISKSARKGPEEVASTLSRTHNIEEDPETVQYLRKIRDADSIEPSEEKKVERSVVTVDFPSPPSPKKTSVTVKLNLDMQKSRIAVARGSGLQGRRKPTTEHIRRSLRLSDDEEPEDVLSEGYEAENEDMNDDINAAITPVEANTVESAWSNTEEPLMFANPVEAKVMPSSPVEYGQKLNLERRGSFEGLIPRSTPKERKPAWKSKTYGGVALPAFAAAMKAGTKSLKKTLTADKLLTVDIVKQAAIDKLNKAAKEDKPEKEPEKPAWMVEAESRRKHHDRRRQGIKQKPPESEAPAIPITLKATGSRIFEDQTEEKQKNTESELQDDSEKKTFVFKLKPVNKRGEKLTFEPEEAKISFKLKSTGIQLIKPEETREEPETPNTQREEPRRTSIQREKPERPVTSAVVKYFETSPPTKEAEKKKDQEPAMTVRLWNVHDRTTLTARKASETSEDSELALKLRRRGKAPPVNPDEEDLQDSREYRSYSLPGEIIPPRTVEEHKPVPQPFKSYVTPKPVNEISTGDYKVLKKEGRYLENAMIVNPPTCTKAESTPPMSPTRTPAKASYKVTPLSSVSPRHNCTSPVLRAYESPIPADTSRAFSPPPANRAYEPPIPASTSRAFSPPLASRAYESLIPASTSRAFSPPPANRAYESPIPASTSRAFSPPPAHRAYESPIPASTSRAFSPPPTHRAYESPIPASTSRAFSPPPLSPTSKVTVVSHHVETPPNTNKSAMPFKAFKGRRVSGERAKTVTIQAGDIPRIIPERRSSSKEHPLKATECQIPQKAKTLLTTDRPLDYQYRAELPGEVLPPWKQDLMERQRNNHDTSRQSRSHGSLSNKENEPRIVTQVEPLWMRELAEKRRNVYNRTQSNGDIQFERIETFEKFEKPTRSEDSDEEVREKPNFMKEFERKRRLKGRGPQRTENSYQSSNSSYV